MKSGNILAKWAIVVVALGLLAAFVLGDVSQPTAPNEAFNILSTARRGYIGSRTIQAEAGNVTEIYINSSAITNGWQGYYGNISGVIVLDDALNNTIYSWVLADPEGEIFASRQNSINWSLNNIVCANSTVIIKEESDLNFNQRFGQDVDGVSETFALTTHPQFYVAATTITGDTCKTVSTYVNDARDGNRAFNETLLYSRSEAATIYTALLYQGGSAGFKVDGSNYDFQMLVAEDGHSGNTAPTDYYFWVELE